MKHSSSSSAMGMFVSSTSAAISFTGSFGDGVKSSVAFASVKMDDGVVLELTLKNVLLL
jgi:hypothetical protein